MLSLPYLRQVATPAELQYYAQTYESCSGLPVPSEYLQAAGSQVFGLYRRGELIGGFILAHGPAFRTIAVFAGPDHQVSLQERFSTDNNCTEICCFFIAPDYRQKTLFNFATWAAMIYAQVRYGRERFLFGTCSRSLAKLYGQTEKSMLIHEDVVNGKRTFIFWAERKTCVQGMLKIMLHKLQRVRKLSRGLARRYARG